MVSLFLMHYFRFESCQRRYYGRWRRCHKLRLPATFRLQLDPYVHAEWNVRQSHGVRVPPISCGELRAGDVSKDDSNARHEDAQGVERKT